ncbi:MBL fold metallo-hydrolase [Photobacterium alginatilyticum]|uniref:MBL fold metallo-hydrolase n=1 Tax=Photobacterium alginatilyticum TaxID=1775171 RepID=A0ABW9YDW9_9GAMM|nr:MBL fold metallo-hydrolase [Photobacterium alginatilyticum]NBI51969.1 MBL fold metallo-hydrolase [Photobacterium alginatilyticum]
MKLTALVDNSRLNSRPDLAVERGLSLHIETMGQQILFDAGSGKAFCDNAALLGVEIRDINAAVISHRHHDHCNGVTHFLDCNTKAQVYFRECEETDYSFKAFGFKSNVGIDMEIFEKAPERFFFVNEMTEILPNIYVVTNISSKYQQPKGNKYLFSNSGKGCKPDTFDHELLLIIKENDGLVVFTGCAHSGVINMVHTAVELFPSARIKAVVGGFHLVGLPIFDSVGGSKEEIKAIGQTLESYPIDKLYTGHCTGMKAFGILKKVLGDRLEHLPTGRSVII